MNIAFIDLAQQQARIRDKIDTKLAAVLNHGAYIMGPEVGVLENRLGNWTKATHNISCSSGTDALLLALHGLELKPGLKWNQRDNEIGRMNPVDQSIEHS